MTEKMSDSQLVNELIEFIGPTVTGVIAKTPSPRDAEAWANGRASLQPEQRARLELAHKYLNDITEREGEHRALKWLLGANCGPDLTSPLFSLREDAFEDVHVSAMRWIDPEEMGG